MRSFSRCRPPLLLLLCCGVAETRPEAIAAEPDPRGTYLTLQISTPLQKRVAGDGVTVVAAVNGDALVEDSTIRAGRIDLEALETTLLPLGKRENSHIDLRILHADDTLALTGNPALKLLRRSLDAVGRNAHFVKVSTGNEYNAGDWDQNIDRSNRAEIDQPDFNETAVTVGKFDIYPVRTFATSFLTDHADCVVYVTEAVHSSDADIISAPDVERLKTAIERLKLPRRDLVRIEVRPSEGGYKAASALSDGGVEKALGFGSLCLVVRPVPVPDQR